MSYIFTSCIFSAPTELTFVIASLLEWANIDNNFRSFTYLLFQPTNYSSNPISHRAYPWLSPFFQQTVGSIKDWQAMTSSI